MEKKKLYELNPEEWKNKVLTEKYIEQPAEVEVADYYSKKGYSTKNVEPSTELPYEFRKYQHMVEDGVFDLIMKKHRNQVKFVEVKENSDSLRYNQLRWLTKWKKHRDDIEYRIVYVRKNL